MKSENGRPEPEPEISKMEISRRNLLKWAGLLTGGAILPEAVKAEVLAPRQMPLPALDSESFRPAVCGLCPAGCMIRVRLVNGKPAGVAGLPGHPLSQGTHCPKGGVVFQELYHPDRLKAPLRRKGGRGSGDWEEISWPQAQELLASKLSALREKGRPEGLAVLACARQDLRHEIQKRFARAFGTPNFYEWNWPLGEPPKDAFALMHGDSADLSYDLAGAGQIVSFGWDWLQAHPSSTEVQRFFGESRRPAKGKRTRLVQIEPRLSLTGAKADDWIAVKPGSEGLLALSVAHVLIKEKLYDGGFVRRSSLGFDEFSRAAAEHSPEKVSLSTGVEPGRIARLAREMAEIRPTLALTCRGSRLTQLAVHSLNFLLGTPGTRELRPAELLPRALPPRPTTPPVAAAVQEIPEIVLSFPSSPIEMLWLEGSNPVFLSPQPEAWRKAVARIPFVASFSSFMDESSALADLVLPLHTALESPQWTFSSALSGRGVLSCSAPIVKPLHNTGDLGDIILQLAGSLGGPTASALPWKSLSAALEAASRKAGVALDGGSWREYGAADGRPSRLKFPGAELRESQLPAKQAGYPLDLCVHVPLAFSFGEGAHLPYLHSLAGAHLGEQWETWVEIHPQTAERLGIADGDMVWVESASGRIKARARHYEGIREDTVSLPFGLGHSEMGRYAQGVGANPADIVGRKMDAARQSPWQGTPVKIYGA